MRTRSVPFQLEQTVPGAFLLQGLTGGTLVGFTCMLLLEFQTDRIFEHLLIVLYNPVVMIIGATFGFLLAVPLWVTYRLTGMRIKTPVRVVVSGIGLSLPVSFLIYKLDGKFEPRTQAIAAGVSFLISFPTALLVGSRVKAWFLFTFWSIAARRLESKKRVRGAAIFAVGGVLPLRLLSGSALVFWILSSARTWPASERDLKQGLIFGLIPIMYLALSVYLTFRSPRKFVLLAIGLAINIPIIYLSFFEAGLYPETYPGDTHYVAILTTTIFLYAWAAFIAIRFAADAENSFPTTAVCAPLHGDNAPKHHCLGSRFLEWTEGHKDAPLLEEIFSRKGAKAQRKPFRNA
jgi:hypothetical protein